MSLIREGKSGFVLVGKHESEDTYFYEIDPRLHCLLHGTDYYKAKVFPTLVELNEQLGILSKNEDWDSFYWIPKAFSIRVTINTI